MTNKEVKSLGQSIKKFLVLVVGFFVWLFLLILISVSLSEWSNLANVFIFIYLIITVFLAIFLSKRNSLEKGQRGYKMVFSSFKNDLILFKKQCKEFLVKLFSILKVLFVVLILIWVISALFDGDDNSSNNSYKPSEYNTNYRSYNNNSNYGSYNDYSDDNYTPEPENPYNEGSGHSAGYEWAEKNGVSSCGGSSNSFIEGCEEYLSQQEEESEY